MLYDKYGVQSNMKPVLYTLSRWGNKMVCRLLKQEPSGVHYIPPYLRKQMPDDSLRF